MSTTVFFAVIGAAILHASWNALVKGGADKYVGIAAVAIGHVPFAVVALMFVPTPAAESFGYLAAGILLHVGYQLFLLQSYKVGDLTQVYPIARGSAPLIVALVSVTVLGVVLVPMEIAAILIIGVGILSLSLTRHADGMRNNKAALFALGTGVFIASYSLIDGIGARLAGTSVGYYAWLSIGNAAIMVVYFLILRPVTLTDMARHGRKVFFIGGGASFVAYALVTWAFTQAPIALVTALRETSIVFALLIGVFFLKERLNLAKLLSTFVTLLGAALLRFART
ncbi:EamA-like transporter family protein [Shimia gijangensis]|uniref:EamA-like transporter family protein n=1 Tax=Shimia gijangensis TaxID=1470563 RepID=A0A1M6JM71_9RHOB|nr:DMT family transporter [Shimia gijangensis]SHJ47809.1 EamA-like transporter family protein [Shimia gijangensis]